MSTEEKVEEVTATETETKKKPGRPVGSKNKRKPGRPKKEKTKIEKKKPGRPVGSKNKKIVIKKTKKIKAATKKITKKGPGRPKIVRVAIKTPSDLIAYMKDLDQKRSAGISAAKRVIRSTVEEITITKDPAKEKELITKLRQMKALVA